MRSPHPARRKLDRDSTLSAMNRLRAPVLRHRIFQLAADAVLAALAFYLAFEIRFIDEPGGIPDRYVDMLTGSIVFVAIGKTVIFSLHGPAPEVVALLQPRRHLVGAARLRRRHRPC